MQKRAAIYCRISDDREGRRLGVQRQEEDCRAVADQCGYDVAEVYIENDTGASSRSKKPRPLFKELLALARSNQYDAVISYSSSRLTRRPLENELLIELYEKHGVLIHYANTNDNDLSTARGRRRARDDAARDAEEVEELGERVSRTAKQRAEEGRPNGGTRPYGWSADDRSKLDPKEHAVIVEMADRVLAGETLTSLAADLNRRRIPTVKGAAWSPTAIRGILTNKRLIALRVHLNEVTGPANWEPALPVETFERLEDLLTDSARRIAMSNKVRNLLTGIALCGECGRPVASKVQVKDGKRRKRYYCAGCNLYRTQAPIDAMVEAAVVEYLRTLGPEPERGTDPEVIARIEMLQQKIRDTQAAFAADDVMTADDLLEVLRPLKEQLRFEERKVKRKTRSLEVVEAAGADAEKKWATYPLGTQRLIISELIEVRILRTVRGKRGFDPETVKLSER
jgi:DNA invertase Pin-like site-specific DNA recombinase